MQKHPVQENHHEKEVWVNQNTESLRREECLCLNCSDLKSEKPDGCPVAKRLYEICLGANIALAVTRCPYWVNN
jgi:hypothetical protein